MANVIISHQKKRKVAKIESGFARRLFPKEAPFNGPRIGKADKNQGGREETLSRQSPFAELMQGSSVQEACGIPPSLTFLMEPHQDNGNRNSIQTQLPTYCRLLSTMDH